CGSSTGGRLTSTTGWAGGSGATITGRRTAWSGWPTGTAGFMAGPGPVSRRLGSDGELPPRWQRPQVTLTFNWATVIVRWWTFGMLVVVRAMVLFVFAIPEAVRGMEVRASCGALVRWMVPVTPGMRTAWPVRVRLTEGVRLMLVLVR